VPIQTLPIHHQEACAHLELRQYEVAHDILHYLNHLKLFFIFMHSFNLLHLRPFLLLVQSNWIISPFSTNLHDLYLNLHFLCPYYLIAPFLPLPYNCKYLTYIL